MNDKEIYEEYYAMAGALSRETLQAIVNDLAGYGGKLNIIRQACRERLKDRNRSIKNAVEHGWIKPKK